MKLNDPEVLGMPEIDPEVELITRPGGSCPSRLEKRYGADPPLTVTTALYGLPTVAGDRAAEMVIFEVLVVDAEETGSSVAQPVLIAVKASKSAVPQRNWRTQRTLMGPGSSLGKGEARANITPSSKRILGTSGTT